MINFQNMCARLGSNQQSPILSRTEVGLRILLLRQLKAVRETVAPIVRVLLYYPPPRANPGRLYHLSTNTFVPSKGLEPPLLSEPAFETGAAAITPRWLICQMGISFPYYMLRKTISDYPLNFRTIPQIKNGNA